MKTLGALGAVVAAAAFAGAGSVTYTAPTVGEGQRRAAERLRKIAEWQAGYYQNAEQSATPSRQVMRAAERRIAKRGSEAQLSAAIAGRHERAAW